MVNEQQLMQKIIETSTEAPVLVDFWAPWCEPCKQLGPVLEKKAAEAAGAWVLVKVNVDECHMMAAQFGIQSIPNCKLIYQGRLMGEFNGALSEEQLDQWLAQHLPEELQKPRETGKEAIYKLLDELKTDEARKALTAFVQNNPEDEEARILLAQTTIFNDAEQAGAMLGGVSEASTYYDKATRLLALVEILSVKEEDLPEAKVKEYFCQAATALKKSDFEGALDAFFDILIRDREYQNDAARRGFLGIFEYLGRDHAISKAWSRRFEMAIFA